MSSEFFKALEQSLQQAVVITNRLEYRAYMEEDRIVNVKHIDRDIVEEKDYIVIDQKTFDKVNGVEKLYTVVDGEVKFTPQKKRNWFLKQEDLSSNPYIGDSKC